MTQQSSLIELKRNTLRVSDMYQSPIEIIQKADANRI